MSVQDWQISCRNLNERGVQLLHSGQWTDCTFLVGSESNQVTIKGHKLFLAMSSPVFEAMFYGGIPERNDPISILDVQPEAFQALLEYIYTDNIKIASFDKACELCYAAKKYMLPHLVKECTTFLWSDLNPKNACRAYEFAKLFEEPCLMEKCLQIISTQTQEVIAENTWEEIELDTMITIFEQDDLQISSELELFYAVVRYANAQNSSQYQQPAQRLPSRIQAPAAAGSMQQSDDNCSSSSMSNDKSELIDVNKTPTHSVSSSNIPKNDTSTSNSRITIRNAIQKIRFLTLTPQQFADGPARSNLLTQSEAFAILMNISSANNEHPMPEGFTTSKQHRTGEVAHKRTKFSTTESDLLPSMVMHRLHTIDYGIHKYCHRILTNVIDYYNSNVLDCSVNFTVNKNICIIGVQIPTQVLCDDKSSTLPLPTSYNEILYAHLLDSDGSRLTYTHNTSRVQYGARLDVTFNRPFFIQKNKIYKVGVVFNKQGWYPMGGGSSRVDLLADNVVFKFEPGQLSDTIKDGLIKSIIFTM